MTPLRDAWTRVQASDYDAHMAAVGQAHANALLVPSLLRDHPPPGPRLVFAGAGTGQMFDHVDPAFLVSYDVTFTDIAPALLARLSGRLAARAPGWSGHREVVDDVEDTRLPGPVDAIVLVLVLEHVDWRKTLRSLAGLEPGRLYVVIQENPPDMAVAITPSREPVGSMKAIRDARPALVPGDALTADMEGLGFSLLGTRRRPVPDGKAMVGLVFGTGLGGRR
jgi:hypothetical protein